MVKLTQHEEKNAFLKIQIKKEEGFYNYVLEKYPPILLVDIR